MSKKIDHVAVDLGYGFVKAMSSTTGKRIIFPALVGKGHELGVANMFGNNKKDIDNIFVNYDGEDLFVGTLAENESRTVSRIFEQERYQHKYTRVLLNTAIQLVTEGNVDQVNVTTGLPLDFHSEQHKGFQKSIIGLQPLVEWKAGSMSGQQKRLNINHALAFPQGASAIFSALHNNEGNFVYPNVMEMGNLVALIDIGFRTTDYVVIEIGEKGSFAPLTKLSGTIDGGVVNLHQQIKQYYKSKTGGADLNEFHMTRILNNGFITYKGKRIDFKEVIESSKASIATSIADRLKGIWVEETDLFEAMFLAGGGGTLFENAVQPHFDNRLEVINDSQFANTIGYLRLGKKIFGRL